MNWNSRYSLISYTKSSLWIVPVIALISSIVIKHLSEHLGGWMVTQGFYDLKTAFFGLNREEAHAFLERIFTLNLSCLVFTFGSLLVAIQVAGGQYTPRIITTTLLCDNVIRCIVGLFIFTLLWVNRALVQLGFDPNVPQLQILLAACFGLISLISFIVLIDYSAKLLRPVSLVRCIGAQGIAVIKSVYPDRTEPVKYDLPTFDKPKKPNRIIEHYGKSGIVLAVNLERIKSLAQLFKVVIEIIPQVGDFLAVNEPLFYLYGDNVDNLLENELRSLVAFGSERTMEQDPLFSFRIEVDIAIKALSPAINDPTTAVLVLDQLHRLVRYVGGRSLHSEDILDDKGSLCVIFRTPNWEDFVHVAFREILHYGIDNLQIVRRLRAMLISLLETLPEHRREALRVELCLLDKAVTEEYTLPEQYDLAIIPDSQGLGAGRKLPQHY